MRWNVWACPCADIGRSGTPDDRVETVPWVVGVKLEIRGREAVVSALVGPAGSTPLIGQIPLEEMDFVVDPKSRELRPNPASPDAPVLDLLRAAS